jgi:hypothetical protein
MKDKCPCNLSVIYESGRVSEIVLTVVDDKTGTTAQATLTTGQALDLSSSLQVAAQHAEEHTRG